jgi:serine/threonine-protein kinase
VADLRLTTSVDDRPGAEPHERRLSGESVASDPFGDRLLSGRYQVRACIGTGASATVHLATDVTLGRPVAVKILHEGLARDDAFLRRFQAEARSAAALNHPHITAVFDWGETDDDIPFLVMEHLAGGSLRTLLDRQGPRSPSQTLVIGLEAARGLDYAHRRGFVHRDVKPANLLFDDEARLRIADFGLARALAEAAWTEPADAVLGTAKYASPEQAMGDQLDGRSDVYALALVLHECLTGAVPFAADTSVGTLMSRIGKVFPAPEGSGPLGELVVWAAAPEPADRPTAGELATALAGISSQLDRPAPLPIVMTSTLGADLATVERPDDLTIVGAPPAPGAAPAGPTGPPPADDRADLTVIAEPDNRTPRRWGRRRFETTAADDDTGGGAAPKAPRGSGRLYDFMQEDDPDFVDDTTGAIAPATRR